MNNKTLGIVFSALLLIYLLFKLFGGNKERSFDPNIIELDTAKVTSILVDPKGGQSAFTLSKEGGSWVIQQNDNEFTAASGSVSSLLNNLQGIRAQRVVSRSEEKWSDYEVDDTGTRITAKAGNKILTDLRVGRFNFNQVNQSSTSYVRPENDKAIYAVEGFLSMTLAQGMSNYRNKLLVQLSKDNIRQMKLSDSGNEIVINRVDNQWTSSDNTVLDSTEMATYLNGVQSVSGIEFAESTVQNNQLLNTLEISGDNMDQPFRLYCYASGDSTRMFALHSTLNEEGYFLTDSSSIYDRTFGKLLDILAKGQ